MVRVLVSCLFFLSSAIVWSAEPITIAVTASFKPVLDEISEAFTEQTGVEIKVSSASTGVLYQQVVSGAPFDLFFAADALRPKMVAETLSLPASSTATYAQGLLVLVSNNDRFQQLGAITEFNGRVIIANPSHAPYGIAAQSVLESIQFDGTPVLANNVTQARQYLTLNLAPVGLIAASVAHGFTYQTVIDRSLYDPIIQQYVILKPSDEVTALLTFLSSDVAQRIILKNGYLLPG
jgi:molybdate transport system substrate-binding protein